MTARRHGDDWYIGGQTNWDERTVGLSLDCLSPGVSYQATIVTDGINANHHAEDYHIEQKTLTAKDTLNLKMASGGGFVVKLIRSEK